MWFETIIITLIVGKIKGGQFKNLLDIYIEKWCLIVIAGLTEFIASLIRSKEIGSIWVVVDKNIIFIHVLIYCLLISTIIINIKKKGFIVILIGILLNFLVIIVNGGKMPVDLSGVSNIISNESLEYIKSGKDLTHVLADGSTRLLFLGDVIHIKRPYPLPKTLSIGDIFLMVGIFVYLQDVMIRNKKKMCISSK